MKNQENGTKNWGLACKSFLLGAIFMLIISGTVVMANPVVREIVYGVAVSFNGTAVNFAEDSRPFVMDGRTFLPVRAVADLFGAGVDFDSASNTVILTGAGVTPPVPPPVTSARTELRTAAPYIERNAATSVAGTSIAVEDVNIAFLDSVTMNGTEYHNALRFSSSNSNVNGNTLYTVHNLNGQYNLLTGHIGRVDGGPMTNITVNIIGDGRILQSYGINASDAPTPISVSVSGVQQLRIEFVYPNVNGVHTPYAFSAFLE